jgi:hypothetical protein
MLSERRVNPSDFLLIKAIVTETVNRLKRTKRKAMYQYLDVDSIMAYIMRSEHAYILGNYLVLYEIDTPWYAKDDVEFLNELLVLKLAVSGDTNFGIVPAFFERKAQEAGAKLAAVGTALAKADAALASLYMRHGFQPEAFTLIKEP